MRPLKKTAKQVERTIKQASGSAKTPSPARTFALEASPIFPLLRDAGPSNYRDAHVQAIRDALDHPIGACSYGSDALVDPVSGYVNMRQWLTLDEADVSPLSHFSPKDISKLLVKAWEDYPDDLFQIVRADVTPMNDRTKAIAGLITLMHIDMVLLLKKPSKYLKATVIQHCKQLSKFTVADIRALEEHNLGFQPRDASRLFKILAKDDGPDSHSYLLPGLLQYLWHVGRQDPLFPLGPALRVVFKRFFKTPSRRLATLLEGYIHEISHVSIHIHLTSPVGALYQVLRHMALHDNALPALHLVPMAVEQLLASSDSASADRNSPSMEQVLLLVFQHAIHQSSSATAAVISSLVKRFEGQIATGRLDQLWHNLFHLLSFDVAIETVLLPLCTTSKLDPRRANFLLADMSGFKSTFQTMRAANLSERDPIWKRAFESIVSASPLFLPSKPTTKQLHDLFSTLVQSSTVRKQQPRILFDLFDLIWPMASRKQGQKRQPKISTQDIARLASVTTRSHVQPLIMAIRNTLDNPEALHPPDYTYLALAACELHDLHLCVKVYQRMLEARLIPTEKDVNVILRVLGEAVDEEDQRVDLLRDLSAAGLQPAEGLREGLVALFYKDRLPVDWRHSIRMLPPSERERWKKALFERGRLETAERFDVMGSLRPYTMQSIRAHNYQPLASFYRAVFRSHKPHLITRLHGLAAQKGILNLKLTMATLRFAFGAEEDVSERRKTIETILREAQSSTSVAQALFQRDIVDYEGYCSYRDGVAGRRLQVQQEAVNKSARSE